MVTKLNTPSDIKNIHINQVIGFRSFKFVKLKSKNKKLCCHVMCVGLTTFILLVFYKV